MTDPIFQPEQDDVGPSYLARRKRNEEEEALNFLFADEEETEPTQKKEEPDPKTDQEDDQGVLGQAFGVVGDVVADVGEGVAELPRAVVGGVREAGQEFLNATNSLGSWLNENLGDLGQVRIDEDGISLQSGTEDTDINLPEIDDPDSVTGGLVKDVTQFLVGFVPALKAVKLTGAGAARVVPGVGKKSDNIGKGVQSFAEASLAGAVADATVFDPYEEKLSDLVKKWPELQNPVTDYLQTNKDDSEGEARFKRALEGLGLGAVTEGLFSAIKVLRQRRLDKLAEPEIKGKPKEIPQAAQTEGIEEGVEESLPGLDNGSDELVSLVDERTAAEVAESMMGPTPQALRNHAPVNVVQVKELSLQNVPMVEARSKAMKIGLDENRGIRGTHKNTDTGWDVQVARKGIEKSVADNPKVGKTRSREELELVAAIPDLIREAVLVESRAATKSKGTIETINRMYAVADVGGEMQRVKLTVREHKDGVKRYYNLEAWELESGKKRSVAGAGEGTSGLNPTSGSDRPSAVDINTLLDGVKRDTDDMPVLQDVDGSKFAANINLSKIDEPDDVKEALRVVSDKFSENIQEARRGKISHEETQNLANDLGMKVEDLLSRRKGQAFNAEEALAARQILASSSRQLVDLAKKASTVQASQADLVAFRRALSVHSSIQAQVSGMTAEAGRALNSFKIMAKGTTERDRQISEMIMGNGGDVFNRDMAQKLANIAEENPAQLNKAAREAAHASGWEQMYEVWINGLLSGPQTHAVNVLSNSLVALWQVPERYVASKIGQAFGDGGVQSGEATAQAFGLVHGVKDGLKLAAKALKTGEGSDVIGKVEENYRSLTGENFAPTKAGRVVNFVTAGSLDRGGIAARGVDLLGEVARVPSRFLTAEDEFFKAVGYRMEVQAQAYRTGLAEGLEGEGLAKRISDIVNNPPENIHLGGVDAARYQTFTQPLGEIGQSAQKFVRLTPGLRLFAPFIRTPTNILKYVGVRSPLAPLSKNIRADIAAGGARRDLALARIGLGSMVMISAADLTSGGFLTGGGPSDKKMKAHLRNTGWQPYSIKLGDQYYSYNRLDPLGMMLGLAADTSEIMGQTYDLDGTDESGSLAVAAVASIAKNVTSKTWLMGVSDLIEAIDNPQRHGTHLMAKLSGTVIPTGVAQVNRVFSDNTLRDTKSIEADGLMGDLLPWGQMLNQIKSRLPGYSDDLPPRTNVWGDPIVLSGGIGPDIVSPIYTSEKKESPADEELLRLGVPIDMPKRQLNGVRMTANEYHRFVVLAGNEIKDPSTGLGFKDTVERLVTGSHPMSSAYKRATDGPDGGKSYLIRRLMTGYREQAKAELLKENPALADLVAEAQKKRAAALTGQ